LSTNVDASTAAGAATSQMGPVAGTSSARLPWAAAAVLAVALAGTWVSKQSAIVSLEGQVRDRDARLQQKDAEISTLKERHSKTVDEANSRLRALADEANQKLTLAQQPEVQVQAGFRKAMLHSGKVFLLRSTAPGSVAVTVDVERPGTGTSRSFDITLDAGQVKEIGELEGWAFVSGDTIKVSRPDHKPLKYVAP
jgi:hypothetical protein